MGAAKACVGHFPQGGVLKKGIHLKMTVLPQARGFLAQNGGFWAQNDGALLASSWGTLPPMGAAMALLADPLDQPMIITL